MELLNNQLGKWKLLPIGPPIHTPSSILQVCSSKSRKMMLKIFLNQQEKKAASLLKNYSSLNTPRVYNLDDKAILMQYIPHFDLEKRTYLSQKTDLELTYIITQVVNKLHLDNPKTQDLELTSLQEWFIDLTHTNHQCNPLLEYAKKTAIALVQHNKESIVLHGDIHHNNIGQSSTGDYLVIDPKGLWGNKAFDYVNIVCNPSQQVALAPGRLQTHLKLISSLSHIPYLTLLQWTLIWSALSAIWKQQDQLDATLPLEIANLAKQEIDKIRP